MQLKNRLKELRARDGLNQTDLAKISQIFNETVESVFRLEEDE